MGVTRPPLRGILKMKGGKRMAGWQRRAAKKESSCTWGNSWAVRRVKVIVKSWSWGREKKRKGTPSVITKEPWTSAELRWTTETPHSIYYTWISNVKIDHIFNNATIEKPHKYPKTTLTLDPVAADWAEKVGVQAVGFFNLVQEFTDIHHLQRNHGVSIAILPHLYFIRIMDLQPKSTVPRN